MIRLLLDTHALLWWLAGDEALSPDAHDAIADPDHLPLVSAASIWEVAIKRSLGKLSIEADLLDAVEAEGFEWLPVAPRHAWRTSVLPHRHRDPFDRLLVAQALSEGVPVVTRDQRFAAYGVAVRW